MSSSTAFSFIWDRVCHWSDHWLGYPDWLQGSPELTYPASGALLCVNASPHELKTLPTGPFLNPQDIFFLLLGLFFSCQPMIWIDFHAITLFLLCDLVACSCLSLWPGYRERLLFLSVRSQGTASWVTQECHGVSAFKRNACRTWVLCYFNSANKGLRGSFWKLVTRIEASLNVPPWMCF